MSNSVTAAGVTPMRTASIGASGLALRILCMEQIDSCTRVRMSFDGKITVQNNQEEI
jgi:hypothetical protein